MTMTEITPVRPAPNALVLLPWNELHPSPLNPRRHEETADPGLVESISRRGVQQNIGVRARVAGGGYELVWGARRYAAVGALVGAGRWSSDVPVPCRIVEYSDAEVIAAAVDENLKRSDLTVLEEGDAYCRLADEFHWPVDRIADETEQPLSRVRRRMALARRLAPEGREALDAKVITAAQAMELAKAEADQQRGLLRDIVARPGQWNPDTIRRMLTPKGAIPLSLAEFPVALYQGPSEPRDLFDDPSEAYAYDAAEFRRLQLEACEQKKAALEKTWSWVEIKIGGAWAPVWEYDRDAAPAEGGAIIHFREDSRVEVHTGLRRRAPPTGLEAALPARRPGTLGRGLDELMRGNGGGAAPAEPPAERAPTMPLARAHMVWARHEKSRRLQNAIAREADAQTALSLMILRLLGRDRAREVHLAVEDSFAPDDRIENRPLDERRAERLAPLRLLTSDVELYGALVEMPWGDRLALFAALFAPLFASWCGYEPDIGDSPLVVAVAGELGLGAEEPFGMNAAYLERLPRAGLLRVARACGALEAVSTHAKKGELVDAILFADDRDPAWYPPELKFALKAQVLAELGAGPAAAAAE